MTRRAELESLGDAVRAQLGAAHRAREVALPACRRAIQACAASIRAVHRLEPELAESKSQEAVIALRQAQEVLAPFPNLAASGPLHDAEKEYAEARLTAALVADAPLPGAVELGVGAAAWLNGLAEAASELRRHVLDRMREGHDQRQRAEYLLDAMDDVYGLLISVDYPDAVTGGLRRTTDALRAVLERTRGDVTTTVLQARLQGAIEQRLPGAIEQRLPGADRPSGH